MGLRRLGSKRTRLGDGRAVIGRGLGGAGEAAETLDRRGADQEAEAVGARFGQTFAGLVVSDSRFKSIEELFLVGRGEGVFDDEVLTKA